MLPRSSLDAAVASGGEASSGGRRVVARHIPPVPDAEGRLDWDTTFVLASGPGPWWGAATAGGAEQFIVWCSVAFSLVVLGVCVASDPSAWLALACTAVALSALVLPAVLWAWGDRGWLLRRPAVSIPTRALAAVVGAVGLLEGPVPNGLAAALAGLVIGCDAALTLRGVGMRIRVRIVVARFAVSGLHLGVLVGLLIASGIVDGGESEPQALLERYALVWLAVGSAAAVLGSFQAMERRVVAEHARIEAAARAVEHRERAHWIHDAVCSELRYVRIKAEQGDLRADEIGSALDDLDHRLRIRQLDELVESGSARVGDVVQPFIRVLQDRRIRVSDVPAFDVANAVLAVGAARALQRTLGVLVPNAIQAGATTVAIRCSRTVDETVIEVEDDAGGFTADELPIGRGLEVLRHELHADLTVERVECPDGLGFGCGSIVRVRLPGVSSR